MPVIENLIKIIFKNLRFKGLVYATHRGSESVSELRNVLHARAHGTFKIERVAVNPACPHWAHMLVFIVHCSRSLTWTEQPSPSPKRSKKKEKKFLGSSKLDIVPDTPTRKSAKAQDKQKALPRLYLPMRLLKHGNREIFLHLRGLDGMDNRRRGPSSISPPSMLR